MSKQDNSHMLVASFRREDAEEFARNNNLPFNNIWTPERGKLPDDSDFHELAMVGWFEMEPDYAYDLMPGFKKQSSPRQRQIWAWLKHRAKQPIEATT